MAIVVTDDNKATTIKENDASQLREDLASITIPFDLFAGISLVTEELDKKGFKYSHFTDKNGATLSFTSKGQEITVTIEKETIVVRQWSVSESARKLEVLYVVKPAQRRFQLV